MKQVCAIISIFLFSCGHTWVVRQTKDSGIIGYKGYWTNQGASEAVDKAIRSHCPNYEVLATGYNYQTATVAMPMTQTVLNSGNIYGGGGGYASYSGTSQQTTYVPTSVDNSYRTTEYSCKPPTTFDPDSMSVEQLVEIVCAREGGSEECYNRHGQIKK